METLNERAGFLCNHEVLAVLRQQRDHRAQRIKDLNRARKNGPRQDDFSARDEIDRIQPQDLHTVTFEALQYLEHAVHPTRRQTTESVTRLLDDLDELDLTKAERLQIVNLAPATAVELHICIEDITDRFDESEQERILALVKSHLSADDAALAVPSAAAKLAEEERLAAEAAQLDGSAHMAVDEREEAELQDDEGLVDDVFAGGRANEDVERDIDEVDD
ncbi:DNA-directed RNA polymerase III subunit RPC17 [Rhodotorula paludigena]|uniref:DNA-directed RNA polymerase III subunit RPC17 n=1 Tax=Rhodotorula paludigena TaxID=86838 RepID=UPI0031723C54